MAGTENVEIVRVTKVNASLWAQLCNELWPDCKAEEILEAFERGGYQNEYLSLINGKYVAFMSLSLRNDYVEGKTDSNPVGYLEGIYVKPEYRKQGIAKELIAYARKWAEEQGCSMLASDCELPKEESRLFHNKMGFVEASINVHFKIDL